MKTWNIVHGFIRTNFMVISGAWHLQSPFTFIIWKKGLGCSVKPHFLLNLLLCFTEESKPCRFGTWRCVNDDSFNFQVAVFLNNTAKSVSKHSRKKKKNVNHCIYLVVYKCWFLLFSGLELVPTNRWWSNARVGRCQKEKCQKTKVCFVGGERDEEIQTCSSPLTLAVFVTNLFQPFDETVSSAGYIKNWQLLCMRLSFGVLCFTVR